MILLDDHEAFSIFSPVSVVHRDPRSHPSARISGPQIELRLQRTVVEEQVTNLELRMAGEIWEIVQQHWHALLSVPPNCVGSFSGAQGGFMVCPAVQRPVLFIRSFLDGSSHDLMTRNVPRNQARQECLLQGIHSRSKRGFGISAYGVIIV